MSGAASFLFRFLEFFIAVSMANEATSDYLQKRRAEAWKVGIDLERENSVCIPAFERTNLHNQLESTELGSGLFYQA